MTPELKKKIGELKKGTTICEIIEEWFSYECKRLEDPFLWEKANFDVEGRANLKASVILRKFVKILKQPELNEIKKQNYK